MSIFDHFPYTNNYELNLDWIISELKKVLKTAEDLESAVKILTTQVDKAVADQLNKWLEDGTLALLLQGIKNVQNYGAKGDGITNDREAINKALDGGCVIYFPEGEYLVDGFGATYETSMIDKGLLVKSHSRIVLNPKAQIKLLQGTGNVRSVIFNIRNVTDVEISGGTLTGDSTTHRYTSGTTDEWCHLINIHGSTDVRLHDMRIEQATGDGVYIGQDGSQGEPIQNNKNVTLRDLVIDTIGRNGVSVCSVDGCTIDNCYITNVYRTNPKAAVDVEKEGSYTSTKSLTGVVINNLHGAECYYSILAYACDDTVLISNMLHNDRLYCYCNSYIDNALNANVNLGAEVLVTNSNLRSLNFLQDTDKIITLVNCKITRGDMSTYKPSRVVFIDCKLDGGGLYRVPVTFEHCEFTLLDANTYFIYLQTTATKSIIRNCTFIRNIAKTVTGVTVATGLTDTFIIGNTTIADDVRGTFFSNNGGEVCTQNNCRQWTTISGSSLASGCVNYK